jgi:hypothetical protein
MAESSLLRPLLLNSMRIEVSLHALKGELSVAKQNRLKEGEAIPSITKLGCSRYCHVLLGVVWLCCR